MSAKPPPPLPPLPPDPDLVETGPMRIRRRAPQPSATLLVPEFEIDRRIEDAVRKIKKAQRRRTGAVIAALAVLSFAAGAQFAYARESRARIERIERAP